MTDKLRFGIMGTGNIARQFANGTASATRSVVNAVGSRTAEAAAAFAERFDIDPAHVHGSYDALLDDPQVDAIYLSLPNAMHCEWTLKALEAGKHVLCEKPIASNEDQAARMFDAAERTGLVLIEAFMYRCHPMIREVVRRVHEGEIGTLNLAHFNFCYHTTKIDGNVRFSADLAGGALMDIGCYPTSFALLLADAQPEVVQCVGHIHETGVDDSAAGVLRFASGFVASFQCSMQSQADNRVELRGTDGFVQIPIPWKPPDTQAEYRIRTMQRPRMEKGAKPEPTDAVHHVDAPGPLYGMEADAFAATVLDGAEPFMSAEHSLTNMRILDACRRQVGVVMKAEG